MTREEKTIAIAGAGSIGCYAGGCLALAGRKMVLLARPRIEDALRKDGLRVSDLDGRDRHIAPEALTVTADPVAAMSGADIVLVTVKSGATEDMAALIAAHAHPDAMVVSLRNGVSNADRLRAGLAGRRVFAGMVPFNVVQSPGGELPFRVHRASEGKVMIEEGAAGLVDLLNVDGFAVTTHGDMKAVQWGKLLMNLNNALVALSGLPLATELSDRRWRLILAGQIEEAFRHRAGTDRRLAPGTAAEGAAPARLAVQGPGAAHACDRPGRALVDVG
ncbi:2-dehydropantoate 2-reductase (fragment) [Mesorhizobium sp. STM 4661]